ncbi:acyltransferase [Nostoc sp. UHCC 0251]|uniref:acyltransferase n=1 Tax=Nostoc sp. UHCC 0251 TaxID=3110240 RepID=UPI002B1EEE85|nr:acyltransferase [Nostoc sp. UHCC 0251]MEA5626093.1 acyltransferase [Nostoc sp. UHCC 0251]
MSFIYLLQNRQKSHVFSWYWLKQWAKRIVSFPKLFTLLKDKFLLEIKGTKIGNVSIISNKIRIEGSLHQLTIGDCTFIGQAYLAIHADISIGSFVVINDGAKLLTASHDVDDPFWSSFAKPIIIDDYAWIATDAIILPGVHIGKGAIVGAGAVVTKNIPEYNIAVGNPAKLLDKQRVRQLKYNPVQLIACYEAWLGKY